MLSHIFLDEVRLEKISAGHRSLWGVSRGYLGVRANSVVGRQINGGHRVQGQVREVSWKVGGGAAFRWTIAGV